MRSTFSLCCSSLICLNMMQLKLLIFIKRLGNRFTTIHSWISWNCNITWSCLSFFMIANMKVSATFSLFHMQAENLAEFYDFCRSLDLARTFQFPILRQVYFVNSFEISIPINSNCCSHSSHNLQPPPSFLATMEEYIREAPQIGSLSNRRLVRDIKIFI